MAGWPYLIFTVMVSLSPLMWSQAVFLWAWLRITPSAHMISSVQFNMFIILTWSFSPNTCPTFAHILANSKLCWKDHLGSAVLWNVTCDVVFLSSCPFTFTSECWNSVKSVLWLAWNKLWPLNRFVLRRQASCVECVWGGLKRKIKALERKRELFCPVLYPLCEFNCLSYPIREEIFWVWARSSTHQLPPNWSTYSKTTLTRWKVGRRRIFRISRANNRYI